MNLRLNYMYRDYGNFKGRNSIVFRNHENLSPALAEELVRSVLIDGMYFVARKAHLPDLFFKDFAYDPDLDHNWHEFDDFEETEGDATDDFDRDIRSLIKDFKVSAKLTFGDFSR
jgi:hypothetical protein